MCTASDLRDLIHTRGPGLWMHGNAHRAAHSSVGQIRIVCNPHGRHDEVSDFDPAGITIS